MEARKSHCCSTTLLYGRTPSEAGFSINLNLYLNRGKSKGAWGSCSTAKSRGRRINRDVDILTSVSGAGKSVLSVNGLVNTWLLVWGQSLSDCFYKLAECYQWYLHPVWILKILSFITPVNDKASNTGKSGCFFISRFQYCPARKFQMNP